jgi:Protein phosphatase 2C
MVAKVTRFPTFTRSFARFLNVRRSIVMPTIFAADTETIDFLVEVLPIVAAVASIGSIYMLVRSLQRLRPKHTARHSYRTGYTTTDPYFVGHYPMSEPSPTSNVVISSIVHPRSQREVPNDRQTNYPHDFEREVSDSPLNGKTDDSPNMDAIGNLLGFEHKSTEQKSFEQQSTGRKITGQDGTTKKGSETKTTEQPVVARSEYTTSRGLERAADPNQSDSMAEPKAELSEQFASPVRSSEGTQRSKTPSSKPPTQARREPISERPASHFVSLNLGSEPPRRTRSVTLAPAVIEGSPTAHILGIPVTHPTMNGDVECGEADTDFLSARAASLRGISHRLDGKPRQDSYSLSVHRGTGAVVAVVGDGVSQASASDLGSRLAVMLMAEAIHASLDRDPSISAQAIAAKLMSVSKAVMARADSFLPGVEGAALASTLVAVIDDGHRLRVVQVGDSPVWKLGHDDRWVNLIAGPVEGAVRDNRTACLPLHPDQAVTCDIKRPDGVIVVMSDGVSDPLGSGNSGTGRYLAERLKSPPDPLRFALDLSFEARGFSDDRTAIAIWATEKKGKNTESGEVAR